MLTKEETLAKRRDRYRKNIEKERLYQKEQRQKNKHKINERRRATWGEESREKARKYEKTITGFLMRKYRNMVSRITGVQKAKAYLYANLEIMPKEKFYNFARHDKKFIALFSAYKESGYERRLSPVPDRIDPNIGYILPNISWITHSENSSRSSKIKRTIF